MSKNLTGLVIIFIILTGCSTTTSRFDLAIADDDRTQVVEVLYEGDPALLRPHNATEGFFSGALAGGVHDCIYWLCFPVLATLGAAGGLLTADWPSTVEQAKTSLESAEVKTRLGGLLIERVVTTGDELTAYQFVATDHMSVSKKLDNPTPVKLIIKADSAGIRPVLENYVFSLSIHGLIEKQKSETIVYRSQENELAYWADDDGTNLQSSMHIAVSNVTEELVRTIFIPDSQQDEYFNCLSVEPYRNRILT